MVISATNHLFLPTVKPFHHHHHHNHRHLQHHRLTTVTFTSTTARPTAVLLKPHAALLPIQPSHLLDLSKTLAEKLAGKLAVSFNEFKTPLLAVANAAAKWVDLYHSVLMVRILLSWFPNMPWETQPFSAIRDLCDPCLSFFRSIMPPTGAADKRIDLSPILAFVFFGVLSSFLKTSVQLP